MIIAVHAHEVDEQVVFCFIIVCFPNANSTFTNVPTVGPEGVTRANYQLLPEATTVINLPFFSVIIIIKKIALVIVYIR